MNEIKPFQLYRLRINRGKGKVVRRIALIDRPAIEVDMQKFNAQQAEPIKFAVVDEDLREILTPVMIPGKVMPRVTVLKGAEIPWYSVFTEEDVREIAEDFVANGYLRSFNLWHKDSMETDDIQILDTFVSSESKGIHNPSAYRDLPYGTWFIRARISDDAIWAQVKDGTFRGVSIEGFFDFVEMDRDDARALAEVSLARQQIRDRVRCAYEALEARHPAHALLSKPQSEWRHDDYQAAVRLCGA